MEDNTSSINQHDFGGNIPEYGAYHEYGYRVRFGRRFGAAIIDFFLFMLLLLIGLSFVDFYSLIATIDPNELRNPNFIYENEDFFKEIGSKVSIVFYIIFGLLHLPQAIIGVTIGKILLSIKAANDNRTQAEPVVLVKRFAIKHSWVLAGFLSFVLSIEFLGTIEFILFVILIISCFFSLGDKGQTLHDMIAKTAVYHKNDILPGDAGNSNIQNVNIQQ